MQCLAYRCVLFGLRKDLLRLFLYFEIVDSIEELGDFM